MPTVEESALRKQMAAGELSGLFVVAGEEKYMVGRLSKQLIKKPQGGPSQSSTTKPLPMSPPWRPSGTPPRRCPFLRSASASLCPISMWSPRAPTN